MPAARAEGCAGDCFGAVLAATTQPTGMPKPLLRLISAFSAWIYRISSGKLMGQFPSGAPVFLLTTKGRRSGRSRTVPLLYLQDGDDLLVVASQGGAPRHPAWYHNLLSDPMAEALVGKRRIEVAACTLSPDEKAAVWPRLVAIYPPYETYQRRTKRDIPVVRLRPC
jgi:F420H(2)-dependent quinone reductase